MLRLAQPRDSPGPDLAGCHLPSDDEKIKFLLTLDEEREIREWLA